MSFFDELRVQQPGMTCGSVPVLEIMLHYRNLHIQGTEYEKTAFFGSYPRPAVIAHRL